MKSVIPEVPSAGKNSMSAKYFLDTNILIYTFDSHSPEKQKAAKKLVGKALSGPGCVSWQVIQEFCNAALKKFEKPMSRDNLREYSQEVLFPLCTIWPEAGIFLEALTVGFETGYSWYDSLIVAAAVRADVKILYSEDLQHSRTYRSLTIKNPFKG